MGIPGDHVNRVETYHVAFVVAAQRYAVPSPFLSQFNCDMHKINEHAPSSVSWCILGPIPSFRVEAFPSMFRKNLKTRRLTRSRPDG
jgi:hypothetical protein